MLEQIYSMLIIIKDLFYHSVRLNAADLLLLYKRMIVLDSIRQTYCDLSVLGNQLLPSVIRQEYKLFYVKQVRIVYRGGHKLHYTKSAAK